MNDKLIRRDVLLDVFDSFRDRQNNNPVVLWLEHVISVVEAATVVDAEPVRYGRWIHCKGKSNLWYCSECGEQIIYNPTRKTYKPVKKAVQEVNKRCRNCGAKMGAADNGQ